MVTKEKATKIVEMIQLLAEAEACIRLNLFCENAESANHNRKIAEKKKQELIDLISNT